MLRRGVLALLLCSNLISGCAAHQARSAGATVAVLGGATTIVGLGVTAGCEPFPDDGETTCQSDDWESNPRDGLRVVGVGLFLVGVGALLYSLGKGDDGSSGSPSLHSSTSPNASSPTPPLQEERPPPASDP